MLNLFLTAFVLAFLGAGMRRPFLLVLAYTYIDIVAPQKVTWGFLAHIPISLISFVCAFGAWVVAENKQGIRFSFRQFLLLLLLVYCGLTTRTADFPVEAAEKWGWVWKALIFAMFLPLTLRTRLRIEALALVMVLSVSVIVIGGGIKTLSSGGGGYGELKLLVNDNTGLYEGSTLSMVAVAVMPLIYWLARYGTIFKPGKLVTLYALGLGFACLLIPIGTQTRTGLLCVLLLGALVLRTTERRFTYLAAAAVLAMVAVPFLPKSYTDRMSTIENHQSDQSASTRVAVWKWTWEFAKHNPFGGGFEAYRQNEVSYKTINTDYAGGNNAAIATDDIVEKGRAYHSAYFEMLGEQGYPGLGLWLTLHLLGLWQMERVRARWTKRGGPQEDLPDAQWIGPLANALQQGQLVYMAGGSFVGIAFQPFMYMLIGLQIGLRAYAMQIDPGRESFRPLRPINAPARAATQASPQQPPLSAPR